MVGEATIGLRWHVPGQAVRNRPCRAFSTRVPITYTADRRQLDVAELADLVTQCSTFAPGHSLHDDLHDAREAGESGGQPLPARLRRALRHSLECVVAFAPEQLLPPHQHLTSRGLHHASGSKPAGGGPAGWWGPHPDWGGGKKVLVGFARAVGDAALVATVHDVVVMPEVRGQGVGAVLVQRLTRQLYDRGIIDVGVVAPHSAEGFFECCGFGDDTEESVVMALTPEGAAHFLQPDGRGGGASKAGADEALMLDPRGFVATCNSTNFFVVRQGEVWCPGPQYQMAGVTRGKVLELCRAHGIPFREGDLTLTQVYSSQEAFVTGTFAGQVPVVEVDGRRIGRGGRGPVVAQLQRLYGDLCDEEAGRGRVELGALDW